MPSEQEQRVEEVREAIYDIVLAARTEGIVGGKTKWFASSEVDDILSHKAGNYTIEELIKLAIKASEEDGLVIKAKDQSLPNVRNAVNKSYNDYMLGQEDMIKSNFVKIIKEV